MAVVTTMVDRITPRTAPDDVRTVLEATGFDDRCPVVTEPFTSGCSAGSSRPDGPAGRKPARRSPTT